MKQWRAVWGVTICLAALCPALALDPKKRISQYHENTWTERDGLLQGAVQAITQTSDGYLWVGTRHGLGRFDGVTFTVYQAEEEHGLRSNDIRALLEDSLGDLWIGTFNGGVSRYRNGRFQVFTLEDGLPSDGVLSLHEDKKGNLWMGTWNGVAKYDGRSFRSFGPDSGLPGQTCWGFAETPEGEFFAATHRGLAVCNDGKFEPVLIQDLPPGTATRTVFVARSGAVWLGTLGEGIRIRELGKWRSLGISEGLADDKVQDIREDRDGNVWIATWGGLTRVQNGRIETYSKQEGLPHPFVEKLFEDREGSLWIGTRGGGLTQLRDSKLWFFTSEEGLPSNLARAALATRDGRFFVGTDGGGVSQFDGTEFHTLTTNDGLPSDFVWALAEDQEGGVWIGTARPSGVVRLMNREIYQPPALKTLPIDHSIRALFCSSDGALWIGGSGGALCRFKEGEVRLWGSEDGLPSTLIRMIGEDDHGNLWIGTNRGLCRLKDERLTLFTTSDGLAHNAVYSMKQDPSGAIWFGSQGGLSYYARDKFSAAGADQGLLRTVIYQILEDHQRNLWCSSSRGIFTIRRSSIDAFHRGESSTLQLKLYGISDGLVTALCEGGSQPAGCKDNQGQLWFPTATGLATTRPAELKDNPVPPEIVIEEVRVNGRRIDHFQDLRLPAGTEQVMVRFTGLSFVAPEKVRFQYRLIGLSDSWTDGENRRVAVFNELPPGRYQFEVTACNYDGVWNTEGASFAFSLAPHFYQTPWLYAVLLGMAGLAGWTFHRRRMTLARQRYSFILAERTRIAQELHDTLAQGFAGIAFQLEAVATKLTQSPEQARHRLELAMSMVRHSLGEARRSVFNLRASALDGEDMGSALLTCVRQLDAEDRIAAKLAIAGTPRSLPPKLENILLRTGQEAITNAVKHGRPTEIIIQLDYLPDRTSLRISDNGCGFQTGATPGDRAHFGLHGMRERAADISGHLSIESSPGSGTIISLSVPNQNLKPENE